jgi:hypothetical protein
LAMRAFFRSAGRSWTTPPETFFALWTVIPARPTIAVLAGKYRANVTVLRTIRWAPGAYAAMQQRLGGLEHRRRRAI